MADEDVRVTSDDDDEAPSSSSRSSGSGRGSGASIDQTDPDAVIGTPTREWVWLAPDWSDYGSSQKAADWTRVQIEMTSYQDGRVITRVLDAKEKPIQHQTLAESIDPKQQERFNKAKAAAERNKPAPATRIVRGADGKNHIMERDPATGDYSIDRGLAAGQPASADKKPPSPSTNWQPLKTPDGKVVALLDPNTGETVPVTQKDPQKPDVFQTKDGRIITVSPDGATARDVTPTNPNDKAPPPGLDYVPDDNEPDGGLAAYNKRLMDAWRAGTITREQGKALLERAGGLYEARESVTSKRRDQDTAVRGQAISQRGQNLGEVASRRQDANRQFSDVGGTIDKLAADLIPADGASGQTIVDAYRAMLGSARRHAEDAGGFDVIPDVPMPAMMGGRPMADDGTGSTQIVMRPGGSIEVSPAGAAPIPTGAAVDAAIQQTQQNLQNTFRGLGVPAPTASPQPAAAPPFNPPAGEPGNDPTKPVGLFDPNGHLGDLVAMGLTPEEAKNAVSLYSRGVREAHL